VLAQIIFLCGTFENMDLLITSSIRAKTWLDQRFPRGLKISIKSMLAGLLALFITAAAEIYS
jgi:hypothetical protein